VTNKQRTLAGCFLQKKCFKNLLQHSTSALRLTFNLHGATIGIEKPEVHESKTVISEAGQAGLYNGLFVVIFGKVAVKKIQAALNVHTVITLPFESEKFSPDAGKRLAFVSRNASMGKMLPAKSGK
jgi:hypothetical protein